MVLNHPAFSRLTNDADFYIVRHGQSAGNHEGRIQGRTDLPLTEKGIDEAHKTGLWFAQHAIDLVCTSPLVRARLTAETLHTSAHMKAPLLVLDELSELETGVFTNKTMNELKIDEAELFHEFTVHSWDAVPGAESSSLIGARAMAHWQWLVNEANTGKRRSITVSHFGMVQWLFKTSFPAAQETWFPLVSVGNCGIFHLHASPRRGKDATNCYLEWRLVNHRVV